MFIIPDSNKIFSFISQCPSIIRFSITIIFLAFLVLSWWLICYKPLSKSIIDYNLKISSLNSEKKKIIEAYSKYAVLSEKIKEISSKFDQKAAKISADKIYQILNFIIDASSKTSLTLDTCKSKEIVAKKWYTHATFDFKFSGLYHNFIKFFEYLGQSNCCIECLRCNFLQAENGLICGNTILKILVINKEE